MGSVSNTVDTVNAAAYAIVSSDSRPLPSASSSVQKRRWRGWSLNWCFGSCKSSSKRIGHAVLVPEAQVAVAPMAQSSTAQAQSTAIVLPFIAPPSSPVSFLQSDPPSVSHSPAGSISLPLLSANNYSPGIPTTMFTIGPYAHETQLVTPPAFSAFTTEPSTASFTPPPESVHLTTPSSPEVPFAQLLTSSLERARRSSGTNHKFPLSPYEFQSYMYPGSPGGHIISPGSVISNSGTSSPFPDKQPVIEFRMVENPKLMGFDSFPTRKWGSRLGSGSWTPDGVGRGSRLGSGTATPDGVGLGSRLGSGTVTPDGMGLRSRLGSGSLTPEGVVPAASRAGYQIPKVPLLTNSGNGPKIDENLVDHRISFELSGEEVARCLQNKSAASTRNFLGSRCEVVAEDEFCGSNRQKNCGNSSESNNAALGKLCGLPEEEQRPSFSGSIKEFNFDNAKGELLDGPVTDWTFFPSLQPKVS